MTIYGRKQFWSHAPRLLSSACLLVKRASPRLPPPPPLPLRPFCLKTRLFFSKTKGVSRRLEGLSANRFSKGLQINRNSLGGRDRSGRRWTALKKGRRWGPAHRHPPFPRYESRSGLLPRHWGQRRAGGRDCRWLLGPACTPLKKPFVKCTPKTKQKRGRSTFLRREPPPRPLQAPHWRVREKTSQGKNEFCKQKRFSGHFWNTNPWISDPSPF